MSYRKSISHSELDLASNSIPELTAKDINTAQKDAIVTVYATCKKILKWNMSNKPCSSISIRKIAPTQRALRKMIRF